MSRIVADALAGVLADSYVLLTKTQNYHWNVVGPNFHSLHLLFEDQYTELFAAVDEIAERIRQLGHPVDGTMSGFLRKTVVSELSADSAPGMVADLAACHVKVGSRVQAALKLAADSGDDGTQDLMVRRLEAHDKAGWMLRSTLGDTPSAVTVAATSTAATRPVAAKKAAKKAKKPAVSPVKAAKPAKDGKAPKAKPVAPAPPKAKTGKKKARMALG